MIFENSCEDRVGCTDYYTINLRMRFQTECVLNLYFNCKREYGFVLGVMCYYQRLGILRITVWLGRDL